MTDRHIWESISTAPKDGTLMFLDYGDGALYLGGWQAGRRSRWVRLYRLVKRSGNMDGLNACKRRFDRNPLRWTDFTCPPLPYREEDEAA